MICNCIAWSRSSIHSVGCRSFIRLYSWAHDKIDCFSASYGIYTQSDTKEVTFWNLQSTIGKMPHSIPNVFFFFQPDYDQEKSSQPLSMVCFPWSILGCLTVMVVLVKQHHGGVRDTMTKTGTVINILKVSWVFLQLVLHHRMSWMNLQCCSLKVASLLLLIILSESLTEKKLL